MNISEIKRFVFPCANSNMYVIAKNGSALVIDPNVSECALEYLRGENVSRITVLLTHEHYDHTSGLTWLCDNFNCTVICHKETASSLRSGKDSRPLVIISHSMEKVSREEIRKLTAELPQNYKFDPEITFDDRYGFEWQGHSVNMISTPGHSHGSCCIEIDDNVVATGDSLILNTPVITRFPGGSLEQYESAALPYLKKIKSDTLVLPGHGETFYMNEVKLQ